MRKSIELPVWIGRAATTFKREAVLCLRNKARQRSLNTTNQAKLIGRSQSSHHPVIPLRAARVTVAGQDHVVALVLWGSELMHKALEVFLQWRDVHNCFKLTRLLMAPMLVDQPWKEEDLLSLQIRDSEDCVEELQHLIAKQQGPQTVRSIDESRQHAFHDLVWAPLSPAGRS